MRTQVIFFNLFKITKILFFFKKKTNETRIIKEPASNSNFVNFSKFNY